MKIIVNNIKPTLDFQKLLIDQFSYGTFGILLKNQWPLTKEIETYLIRKLKVDDTAGIELALFLGSSPPTTSLIKSIRSIFKNPHISKELRAKCAYILYPIEIDNKNLFQEILVEAIKEQNTPILTSKWIKANKPSLTSDQVETLIESGTKLNKVFRGDLGIALALITGVNKDSQMFLAQSIFDRSDNTTSNQWTETLRKLEEGDPEVDFFILQKIYDQMSKKQILWSRNLDIFSMRRRMTSKNLNLLKTLVENSPNERIQNRLEINLKSISVSDPPISEEHNLIVQSNSCDAVFTP